MACSVIVHVQWLAWKPANAVSTGDIRKLPVFPWCTQSLESLDLRNIHYVQTTSEESAEERVSALKQNVSACVKQ